MLNFFKRKKKTGFVFTTKNIEKMTPNGAFISSRSAVLDRIQALNYSDYITVSDSVSMSGSNNPQSVKSAQKEEARQVVNPKDVFKEIKTESPLISFESLPGKIEAVSERLEILSEHLDEEHLMDEHRTLFYLKNRLKYLTTMKKTPIDWAMTTRDAIDDLCKRYALRVVPLKQYYTTVPKEGLKEISRYTKAYKAITGDSPIFELVIKDASLLPKEQATETKKKDRDPILLANSPLGNHLFILGAWDDEVEIVDEIIYGLK